ncbi:MULTISPECIES: 5' DNA nuclease [unclassified Neorhizobium]|uniref:5' DNA nuclease n=1 Tax=unclassified Neorhizobium TaxID=2629175 RepID=UPI001FF1B6D3|nr:MULTISPECIES: 5' DNA nuclease [unclassified Neorhizobium]MCJ9671140.1 5' DNA nuclease [Neorhizobium sp. SHOUNA12B]MCJ9749014.1 5' DNA nuclease [Neorhizobium sp. SHOUNA12A]
MTKSGKEHEREAADRPALDPARMPDFSEAMKLNPLMANMAAATAIGFGIATQMAGVFFGALQGAMEAGSRQKAADPNPAEASPIAETPAPAETPAVAEPVVAAATAKPVAVKPKAPRKAAAPVLKAAPVAEPVAKAAPAKAAPKAAPKVSARQPAPVKPAKAKTAKAPAGGDLKQISGIGPKLAEVLNGLGVTSLAQVAAWNEADIARFDKELGFEGRISRDDWVGQAKALLK